MVLYAWFRDLQGLSKGLILIITRPISITHNTLTLMDNIYIFVSDINLPKLKHNLEYYDRTFLGNPDSNATHENFSKALPLEMTKLLP